MRNETCPTCDQPWAHVMGGCPNPLSRQEVTTVPLTEELIEDQIKRFVREWERGLL
ncbi:MAG TPA: hypothetical protein VHU24_06945 [Solirubrobacterales bacterium]|jgi:hypothetical protein|nr:hypothetical protein [Solirubrobacterales bacterium]